MTSTREDMRRELRDLAKLASVIPRDQQGAPASVPRDAGSSSRVTVPPAIATVPPSASARRYPPPAPLPFPRPPPRLKRPAPVAASAPPAASPSMSAAAEARASWRGNVSWVVAAGVAAVALLVAVASSSLAPNKTASAGRPAELGATIATTTAAPTPAPTSLPTETHWAPVTDVAGAAPSVVGGMPAVVPTTTANDLPPATALPTVVTITGSCPPPAMIRMTRPVTTTHHVAAAPAPRSPFATGATAGGGAPKSMVAKSSPPRASGRDSLDDLIRRAAGN